MEQSYSPSQSEERFVSQSPTIKRQKWLWFFGTILVVAIVAFLVYIKMTPTSEELADDPQGAAPVQTSEPTLPLSFNDSSIRTANVTYTLVRKVASITPTNTGYTVTFQPNTSQPNLSAIPDQQVAKNAKVNRVTQTGQELVTIDKIKANDEILAYAAYNILEKKWVSFLIAF